MKVRVSGQVAAFFFCSLFVLSAWAEDELWEWVTPRPQGHSLSAAAFGNGVVVAVGAKGTVITRTDGVDLLKVPGTHL